MRVIYSLCDMLLGLAMLALGCSTFIVSHALFPSCGLLFVFGFAVRCNNLRHRKLSGESTSLSKLNLIITTPHTVRKRKHNNTFTHTPTNLTLTRTANDDDDATFTEWTNVVVGRESVATTTTTTAKASGNALQSVRHSAVGLAGIFE